jgi:hypothetical protein
VPTPEFVVDDVWCSMVGILGFGDGATVEVVRFWTETFKAVYRGDEGRKELKMALVCFLERGGILLRLRDVVCPVYWLRVSVNENSKCLKLMLTLPGNRFAVWVGDSGCQAINSALITGSNKNKNSLLSLYRSESLGPKTLTSYHRPSLISLPN